MMSSKQKVTAKNMESNNVVLNVILNILMWH